MRSRKSKLSLAIAAAAAACVGPWSDIASATVAYTDNFNLGGGRTDLNTGGTYTYTTLKYDTTGTFVIGSDGAALLDGSRTGTQADTLSITNDGTAAANTNGAFLASVAFTGAGGYNGGVLNPIFNANAGKVIDWSFNMQQIRANPSGFSAGNYGAAYVLGATNADFYTLGDGYAVVMGNTGTSDFVRLIKYTGGLNSVALNANSAGTNIISNSVAVGVNHWSVKVRYDPADDSWELFTRNDAGAFVDPLTGTVTGQGKAVDSTYTGSTFVAGGYLWNYATAANQPAKWDNATVDVINAPAVVTGRNLTWDGNAATGPNPSDIAGNWTDADNWYDGAANTTWNSAIFDNAIFGAGGPGVTVTLASPQAAGKVTFNAGSPGYVVTGSTLRIQGEGGVGITANDNATINSNLEIYGPQSWTVASGKTLAIGDGTNGSLNLNGSPITKQGDGTLLLQTASPSFGGAWFIKAGTVRPTVAVSSVTGLGVGNVTIQDTGTLEVPGLTLPTGIPILMKVGGTLKFTGVNTYTRSGFPQITNASGSVFITAAGASDQVTFSSAIRQITPGTNNNSTIEVNGAGKVIMTSGGLSATDTYGGSWKVTNGVLQLGPSTGEALNSPGFKSPGGIADAKNANDVRVEAGGNLWGASNTPLNPLVTPPYYRAGVDLAGGKMASLGLNTNWGGHFTVSANSTVQVFDPASTATSRDVNLVAGAAGTLNQQGNTTWNANLEIDPGPGGALGGAMTINRDGGTVAVAPGATITVKPGATLNLDGTLDVLSDGTDHVNVANNSTQSFNVLNGTKNVGNITGVGNTNLFNAAQLNANLIRQNRVEVTGTAKAKIRTTLNPGNGGTGAGASKLNALPIVAGGASFDLNDGKLIVQFGTDPSPVAAARAAIILGRGGTDFGTATWQGTGGIASDAAAVGGTGDNGVNPGDGISFAIGYVENSFLPALGLSSYTEFGGQTVDSGSLLIRFTRGADCNLDGKVNTDDVTIVGATFGTTNAEWSFGDFDYDGVVDSDDVTVLGALYDATAPALSQAQLSAQYGSEFAAAFARGQAMAAVPEPGSAMLLGIGVSLAASRRVRRRRQA